jgi:hypothetical protein
LIGVDAIASGSISDLTKTVEINAGLISTETGEVFSAASVEIVKDESVCNLMGGCRNAGTAIRPNSSPVSGATTTSERPKSWTIDSNFFTFELQGCKLSGEAAICDFIVTNNDKDRQFKIYFSYGLGGEGTKIFDDLNNSYRLFNVDIPGGSSDMSFSASWVHSFMVSGIGTKVRLSFKGLKPESSRIALFVIYANTDLGEAFQLKFRDIPLREGTPSRE